MFEDRILMHIEINENGCWLWQKAISAHGYAKIGREYVHRISYQTFIGRIPDGLVLDHLCEIKRCVNPYHLEPVTIGENVLRGNAITANFARATHCVNGHEFIRKDRVCRICIQERQRTPEYKKYHREYIKKRRLENAYI